MTVRDGVILAGWLAVVVGLCLALPLGWGVAASGAVTMLLAFGYMEGD